MIECNNNNKKFHHASSVDLYLKSCLIHFDTEIPLSAYTIAQNSCTHLSDSGIDKENNLQSDVCKRLHDHYIN